MSGRGNAHDLDAGTRGNIARVRNLLARLNTSAKKSLGQNFLVDDTVLQTILDAARLSPGDNVIEVGPGLGILTRELARRAACVVAIEIDDILAAHIERAMGNWPNVTILHLDVLATEPWTVFPPPCKYKVVANLPYNIALPTLRRFLATEFKPEMLIVMVQKEVAYSIAARPGKAGMSSIMVQYYAAAEVVAEVPPSSFYPPPKVSSAILKVIPRPAPAIDVGDADRFFDFVGRSFSQPRKHLSNSMSQGLGIPASDAAALLTASGIDSRRRPQELTIVEWATLWKEAGREAASCTP